jgi:hypothetical protein
VLKEQLRALFNSYDPPIRQIIAEVGELEQRHISMERPRLKDQIDEIITRVANQVLEQAVLDSSQE